MKILRVVGCFIESEGKFLIVQRHPNKPEGNTWGVPAGKVDEGETDHQTCVREVYEETGISMNEKNIDFLGEYVFNFPDKKIFFQTFRHKLTQPTEIKLRDMELQNHKWVTAEECYAMNDLIFGLHELLVKTGYISK